MRVITMSIEKIHEETIELGKLLRDYMLARYGKANSRQEFLQLMKLQSNKISTLIKEFKGTFSDPEQLSVDYALGCSAGPFFDSNKPFGEYFLEFHKYIITNEKDTNMPQTRAQLTTALGAIIDFAPKNLFAKLSFFESQDDRREKLRDYFLPLITLINAAPDWEKTLVSKFSEEERKQAYLEFSSQKSPCTAFFNKNNEQFKVWRDEFVGEHITESNHESNTNGMNSSKGKAILDFIDGKFDYATMIKSINIANETINGNNFSK